MNKQTFFVSAICLLATVSGFADSTYTYSLRDSEATISGFVEGVEPSGSLSIPSSVDGYTVVAIAGAALYDQDGLTSVTFASGSSVSRIGDHAFAGCDELVSVTLPDGVTEIPSGAFFDCPKLSSIELSDSLTKIGDSSFAGCVSLVSIEIPSTLAEIGSSAFSYCESLASIELPSGVAEIPDAAFLGCSALSSIDLASTVSSIGSSSFAQCDSLVQFDLPSGLTSVGEDAFRGCDELVQFGLNASITSLADSVLADCPKLEAFTVAGANTSFSAVDGVLYDSSQTTLVRVPAGKDGSYELPSTVGEISTGAFAHCAHLESVGLTSQIKVIPAEAFYYATGLESITFPETITSIGEWAFGGCSGMDEIELPANLLELGADAFHYASSLSSALFLGDSPGMGEAVFDNTASDFTIYYLEGASGFTTPTWMLYAAYILGDTTTFVEWLVENGFSEDTDISDDVNGDGVSLGLAYAFGLDPAEDLSESLPKATLEEDGVSLSYYGARSEVTYEVEASTDLVNWSDSEVELVREGTDGVVKASALAYGESIFLRLRILFE
ncbi:leucine-rich repeat domain-containing protein [Pelagicoccus albus]|uniref:Leucine-rich repeat domain-containing protein n=1 Tax=Pelagicoccus albus TaxID=415222 RepID=A0A7X1B419_9BACT|nr:leucine-rich repeat domain-containing protein [Pelagicoccus albus]MBC2605245.1 leucine-rich repeat domain-containing protein [Pelagicoccus albus]